MIVLSGTRIKEKPVLLIQPRLLLPSVLYTVIIKDGYFYFCKLGHKFYATAAQENRYQTHMPESELLKEKGSFKIQMDTVEEIHRETRREPWTASWDNYGIVLFKIGDKTRRFILCSQTPSELLAERLQSNGFTHITMIDNAEPTGFCKASDRKADRANTKKVKQLGYILNTLTVIGIVWVFFLPYSLTDGAILNILLPIAALLAQWKYRGFFRSRTRNSFKSNSSFFIAILIPPLILSIKTMMAIHVTNSGLVLLVFLLLTVVIVTFSLFRFRRLRSKSVAIMMMLFIFAYLYSGVLTTNSMVTSQKIAQYQSTIENRYTRHSYRSTSFYLTLSAWGNHPEGNDVSVDAQTYAQASIGDYLHISQERGLWGIEWNRMSVIKRN